MKTKTITLYEYSELSPEAKAKALAHYREHDFDSYGLQVHLDNELDGLLKKHGIKPTHDLKGYESKHAQIQYSLTNSQGDGVMFEGVFKWKDYAITIKQSGHYYHSNSKIVEITDDIDGEATEQAEKEFEIVYQKICKELEKLGYSYIEDMESEDAFIEHCNANEYTFREDGTMEN